MVEKPDTIEALRRRLAAAEAALENGLSASEARYRSLLEAAEKKGAELGAVLESISDAVYLGDLGGITLANQAALDQLGFATREELNRNIGVLAEEIQTRDPQTGETISAEDQPFARALGGKRVVRNVRVRHRLTGEERVVRCSASPVLINGRVVAAVAVNTDVTIHAQADAVLRESRDRQAFLLKLSDAVRTLADPVEIEGVTTRLLAEHFAVANVNYASIEVENGEEFYVAHRDYAAPGRKSFRGRYLFADFPAFTEHMRSGATMAVREVASDPRLAQQDKDNYAANDVGSYLIVPLVKGGRLAVILAIHDPGPRDWTTADTTLAEEVAERTWAAIERARAEAALRQSEERFRQFAEASADAIWIRNAGTLGMEYVSPAVATIFGVEPDVLKADPRRWAALVVPDDRENALAEVERARNGEVVVHEFRILRPPDHVFRWIRSTDFPLWDEQGRVQRIGSLAQDVTDAKLSIEHQAVLLAELQHRVRNIMAIIQVMISRTADGAHTTEEYASLMNGRLFALARVQALLTRAANVGVDLGTLVRDELSAQATQPAQYDASGPEVILSPKAAESLSLAIHELATNALKHGALSTPTGRVQVRWKLVDKAGAPWVSFDWRETGAPQRGAAPARRRKGFGAELIEGRIPYQLGGEGVLTIGPGGARCHLEFPLEAGASILETDAPQRATVSGGGLDMSEEADLSGQRVLVVEDDFFLAADETSALQGAGAEVIGPCQTQDAALTALSGERPTGALVDINLGEGPSFAVAEALRDRHVPFVFVTGYDQSVIPTDFTGTPRLEKPVDLRRAVNSLAQAIAQARQA